MSHRHHDVPLRVLGWCVSLQALGMVVEFIGGYLTHSYALINDAWHMAADVLPAATTLVIRGAIQHRRRNGFDRDFGRGVLGSGLFNALTLVLAGVVALAATSPAITDVNRVVHFWWALGVAGFGWIINWRSHRLLERHVAEACEHDTRFDIRSLRTHFRLDQWGSVVAIIALALNAAYATSWWDTAGGIIIGLWMLYYGLWLVLPREWKTRLTR